MTHLPLLDELAIVTLIAVLVMVTLSKFKMPTVAGLLLTGALLGPAGFGVSTSAESIEVLAEIGVVFLLFTIGLEFSLSRLKVIFKQVLVGGILQVGLTTLAIALLAIFFDQPLKKGIFYGFVFALSSTAIVLRALTERGELDAPHGKFIVGTLIFQDLCVVPMVLIVPLLSASADTSSIWIDLSLALIKATVVVVVMISISSLIVPKLLKWVDSSRSNEVFLLAIIGICIGTAWITSLAGLSLALGAFLGGVVVADTDYRHRALGDILPLRDTFVSIFFFSLGMIFDIKVLFQYPLMTLGLLFAFIFLKGFIATFAAMSMHFPSRAAWLAGVGLAQFGEFGFVLTKLAQANDVIDVQEAKPLLTAGILSMFFTPLLVRLAPHMTSGEKLLAPLEKLMGIQSVNEIEETSLAYHQHIIIIGFGLAGQAVANALKSQQIEHLILELNINNVKKGKEQGFPIYYGDATSAEALHHAHLEHAKAVVVLINDPLANQRIIHTIKRLVPNMHILTRTRYILDRQGLYDLGAKDVVVEEIEGTTEIVAKLLRRLAKPRNLIDDQVRLIRKSTQETDKKSTLPRSKLSEIKALEEMKIESVVVLENSPALGKSLAELALRSKSNASVIGIIRHQNLLDHVDAHLSFEVNDIIYLAGRGDALQMAYQILLGEKWFDSDTGTDPDL
jgi:CPA2 family monovalent cation:H+ antiporter-2